MKAQEKVQDHTATNQRWENEMEIGLLHFSSSKLLEQLNNSWSRCLMCICHKNGCGRLSCQQATTPKQSALPSHHYFSAFVSRLSFFFFSVRSVSIRMDGVMGCLLEGEEYGALQVPIRLLGSQEGIVQGMLQMKDRAGDEEAKA